MTELFVLQAPQSSFPSVTFITGTPFSIVHANLYHDPAKRKPSADALRTIFRRKKRGWQTSCKKYFSISSDPEKIFSLFRRF